MHSDRNCIYTHKYTHTYAHIGHTHITDILLHICNTHTHMHMHIYDIQKSKATENASKNDERPVLIVGSCHCGNIKYELLEFPDDIQHCYCSVCRTIHGSPVASWCPMQEADLRWVNKSGLQHYSSSEHVKRSFCGKCGSNIALKYSFQEHV